MQAKSQTLVWLILIAVVVVGGFAFAKPLLQGPSSSQVISTDGPSLTFDPSSLKLAVGKQASINLNFNPSGLSTAALTLSLSYDPNKVRIISFNGGSLFTNVLSSAKISSGVATISLAASPDSGGQTNSGTAAVLTIESLSSGKSEITFDSDTMAVTTDQEGNILKTLGQLSIN
jgi:hypothetical protein